MCSTSTPSPDAALLEWLIEHGAVFPKLEWPSFATVSGVRGVVALDDIAPGEKMIFVPQKLMITPPLAEASAELGDVYAACPAVFGTENHGRDDYILCVYLMHHMLDPESFWRPYLDSLPEPSSCSDWSDTELTALHDGTFESLVREHIAELREEYEYLMTPLCARFPLRFDLARFGFALFQKCWMTIQGKYMRVKICILFFIISYD